MANKTANDRTERELELIQIVGAITEKTAKLLTEKEAQDKKVAQLIPKAAKALLDNQRIEVHEKEAAEKLLADPVNVLEMLIATAAHRNNTELSKLGQPVEKKAGNNGYNSLTDNYVGRRSRPGEAESSLAFKRGLGIN